MPKKDNLPVQVAKYYGLIFVLPAAALVGLVGLAVRRMSFGDRLPLGAFLAGAAVVVVAAR